MRLFRDPIVVKSLSKADLGWSSKSHQTHLGLPAGYCSEWKKSLSYNGFLIIKENESFEVSFHISPITRKNGDLDAPKIRTMPFDDSKQFKVSALKLIREESDTLSKIFENDSIIFLFCFNDGHPICILEELNDDLISYFRQYSNKIIKSDTKRPIPLKLIKPNDENYGFLFRYLSYYFKYVELKYPEKSNNDLLTGLDERKRIKADIVSRWGQNKFRVSLLKNYAYKCAITGCDILETLEACHIIPYKGEQSNTLDNGIILRSDLHTLYDLGAFYINESYRIKLSNSLKYSDYYKNFENIEIQPPHARSVLPNKVYINYNREWAITECEYDD